MRQDGLTEDVVLARDGDEAVTLLRVEPLDGARHSLEERRARRGPDRRRRERRGDSQDEGKEELHCN